MAGVRVPANIGTVGWGFSYQWLQGVAELVMVRRRVLVSVGWPEISRRRQLLRRRSSVEDAPVARVTERRNDHVKKMRKAIKESTGGRGGIGAVWTRRNGWSPSMVAAELRGMCVQPGGVGARVWEGKRTRGTWGLCRHGDGRGQAIYSLESMARSPAIPCRCSRVIDAGRTNVSVLTGRAWRVREREG